MEIRQLAEKYYHRDQSHNEGSKHNPSFFSLPLQSVSGPAFTFDINDTRI